MGASIYWRPVDTAKHYLEIDGRSSFIAAIERAFGKLPVKLSCEDIPMLKGMAAVADERNNPYEELISKIGQVGTIEVWAEW